MSLLNSILKMMQWLSLGHSKISGGSSCDLSSNLSSPEGGCGNSSSHNNMCRNYQLRLEHSKMRSIAEGHPEHSRLLCCRHKVLVRNHSSAASIKHSRNCL